MFENEVYDFDMNARIFCVKTIQIRQQKIAADGVTGSNTKLAVYMVSVF